MNSFVRKITILAACLLITRDAVALANARDEWPPLEKSVEPVTEVFAARVLRPLDRTSFKSLRRYFSLQRQYEIEKFLVTLDALKAARDNAAKRLGVSEQWWWPADIDLEVHNVLKNDPLTDRGALPTEVRVGDPHPKTHGVMITVSESYGGTVGNRADTGQMKTVEVRLVPDNGRWVIVEAIFTRSSGTEKKATTLSRSIADATDHLRKACDKLTSLKNKTEVRPARGIR